MRGMLVILWMSLVGVAAWGIVLWDWGCGTKSFRCLGVFREKASRGPLSDVIIEL